MSSTPVEQHIWSCGDWALFASFSQLVLHKKFCSLVMVQSWLFFFFRILFAISTVSCEKNFKWLKILQVELLIGTKNWSHHFTAFIGYLFSAEHSQDFISVSCFTIVWFPVLSTCLISYAYTLLLVFCTNQSCTLSHSNSKV